MENEEYGTEIDKTLNCVIGGNEDGCIIVLNTRPSPCRSSMAMASPSPLIGPLAMPRML